MSDEKQTTEASIDLFAWLLTEPGRLAVAGALGGVVRWISSKESRKEGVGSIIVGCICALYAGPLVIPIFEPFIGKIAPGGDTAGFSAFVIGMGGMTVSGIIMDVWARFRKVKDDET